MNRRMLKSKIHRAMVTEARVHYEGSVTVDGALLDAANIREYEEVHVWDVTNGTRLTTYAIRGAAGSGIVAMNGAAALAVKKGDTVIIASFTDVSIEEAKEHRPLAVFVDHQNHIASAPEADEC